MAITTAVYREALTEREEDAELRLDFAAFAQRCFRELNPLTALAMNWHVEVMTAKLAAVYRGEIRRLIVNVPPRYLKSLLASVAFPAWCLGHDPAAQIICASYAQELADKLSRDCRRIVMSDWYQRLYPTRLSPERQAVGEFETTAQGCRLATSVGGVMTGRGADLIIIDDPLKPGEALSQSQRRAANEWFDHTLYSRLNDKQQGAIVLIMHRLHEDDLVGHVLAQEPWEVVCFPAIAEDDETQIVDTVWRPKLLTRRRGEALHPAREPLPMLEHLRHMIGEYNFAGQYQQAPTPLGGGLVKGAWFKHYQASQLPQQFERIVQSWDTANKATELSPHPDPPPHAGEGRVGVHELGHRRQGPLSDRPLTPAHGMPRAEARSARAIRAVQAFCRADRGQGLGHPADPGADRRRLARRDALSAAIGQNHAHDAQTAMIENGFVYLPDTAPWLNAYLHELASFPNGRHDDQVDSTAQMLDWFKRGSGPSSNAGIFELYRRQAESFLRAGWRGSMPAVCRNRGDSSICFSERAAQSATGSQTRLLDHFSRAPRRVQFVRRIRKRVF